MLNFRSELRYNIFLQFGINQKYKVDSKLGHWMAAQDLFHQAVKVALQKENWVITDDPLKLEAGGAKFEIDRTYATGTTIGDLQMSLTHQYRYQDENLTPEPNRILQIQ